MASINPEIFHFSRLKDKIANTPIDEELMEELSREEMSSSERECVKVSLRVFQAISAQLNPAIETIAPLTSRESYRATYGIDLPESLDDMLLQDVRRMNFDNGSLYIHLNKSRDGLVGEGGFGKVKKVWAFSVDDTGALRASPLVQTMYRIEDVRAKFPLFPAILHQLLSYSAGHPILPVRGYKLDAGKLQNKLHVLTPYCSSTLADRLTSQNHLTNAEIVQLFEELLQAAKFCHERGLVHYDIKPDNIFILDGHFFLGDFNLSRPLGSRIDRPYGTPVYADSRRSLQADSRMDLYAIGQVIGLTIIRNLTPSIVTMIYKKRLNDIRQKILNRAETRSSFQEYSEQLEQLYEQALANHPLEPLTPLLRALFSEQPPTDEDALKKLREIKEELSQRGAFSAVRETPEEEKGLDANHRALLDMVLASEPSGDSVPARHSRHTPPSYL